MPSLTFAAALFVSTIGIIWGIRLKRQMAKQRAAGDAERAAAEARAAFYKALAEKRANAVSSLPLALAEFDAGHTLEYYNAAYAEFWDLPAAWLDTKPFLNDILNRLREGRRLPEQRHFSEWKRHWIEAIPRAGETLEETWHLPSGKSVRLIIQSRADGGSLHFCEDISRQLRLESALNLLMQVQRATLDTLEQGIAIFGTDGRLMVHNAGFAAMWRLTENELTTQPHLTDIVARAKARLGEDGVWAIVARGVNSPTPECCGEWEKVRWGDGRIMSLALSRLPNGATLASFTDITDLERFRLLQRETLLTAIA